MRLELALVFTVERDAFRVTRGKSKNCFAQRREEKVRAYSPWGTAPA